MNILSLFDGMSCGMVALKRAEISVEKYYASEIDKYALTISKKNHPEIIQLGDIKSWKEWGIDFSKIDLIMAGFPCQAWSIAGKQKGENDPRGALVHDLIAVWNEIKKHNPEVKFLFENVKMKKEFLEYVNSLFGVEPIMINSSLVSAQNRKRYYWTNIPEVYQPQNKYIFLKDIVHENCWTDVEKSYCIDANYSKGGNLKEYFIKKRRQLVFEKLRNYIVPLIKINNFAKKEKNYTLNFLFRIEKGRRLFDGKNKSRNFREGSRVYSISGKSSTLTSQAKGSPGGHSGLYGFVKTHTNIKYSNFIIHEKNGDIIEGYVRKLTPIECERLQTLSDNYTEGVSNSQRYKMIGNGWTVDVISHILKKLKT